MKSFAGVVIGTVTQVEDPDRRGQVKVRFPWLRPDHETDWVRIATLMAGHGRGSYFIPEIGDEVLVAFEHGDSSYPYVIGFLWNGKDLPPDADINPKVRRLQSVSGHLIEFDDNPGKEHILIKTKSGHRLLFDDAGGGKIELFDSSGQNSITINTQSGNVEIAAANTLSLKAAQISLDAQQISLTAGGSSIQATSGSLTLKAPQIDLN